MPTKPTNHTVWVTDGDTNKQVQPMSGKQLLGWVVNDKPPFQTWNWLHWNAWQWETYFEQITDLHSTQIATLNSSISSLSNASGITAATAGHTTATGVNVQLQLDELDAAIKNIEDAVTSGQGIDLVGYVPASPGNWDVSVPTHAGPALDQLAARMRTVEAATSGANYDDKSFYDYIVPADSPNGAGNTGLTDNSNTNPRGIKLADGKLLYGEDRIYFRQLAKTGNYDANGLPEWAPTSPTNDVRIRLYGQWDVYTGAGIYNLTQLSINPGDYVLITGVFDGAVLMGSENTNGANQVEVWVDGVDTGTNFSMRTFQDSPIAQVCRTMKYFNNQMIGLTQGLHTIKLVNGASDAFAQMQITGVSLINTVPIELASTMYVQKVQLSYAQQSPTLIGANSNGGIVSRYVDRADNLRKEIASNGYTFNTAITGSVSSGATGFTVNSASGLGNNDLLIIQDSPSNSEIVLANSVNTGSGAITIAGSGLRNSYTNPTVQFYGRVNGAVNHSNERPGRTRHWTTMGTASNAGYAQPSELNNANNTTIDYGYMEDGATRLAGSVLYNRVPSWNTNEPNMWSLNTSGAGNGITYEGCFTGLDVFINGGTNGTIAGKITIVIDGVLIASLVVLPALKSGWFKLCSDLPMGHHIVHIMDATGAGYQYGFTQFQEYIPKLTATELALAAGDLLSHRQVLASYVWDNYMNPGVAIPGTSQTPFGISKGVVRHHWGADAILTGSGWSSGASVTGYQGGALVNSATTNDKLTKSFFGTGIDIRFQLASNYGKAQIQIDGQNATSANFPSAVFNGTTFNTGTGIIDLYNASVFQYSVSLANLSATPQWHTITMTVTGTKNVSSAGFYCNVQAFDVHGAVQTADNVGGVRPMHSQILGGIHDKRSLSYNGFDTLGVVPGFTARAISSSYGVASGSEVVPDGSCGDLYLPEDSMVQIDWFVTFRTTGSGDCEILIVTDGSNDSYTYDNNFGQGSGFYPVSISLRKFMKKGWHQIAGQIVYSGSGSGYAYGSYRELNAYAVPKQRAI